MTKERILVVDDEEDILELVHYNLVREGYHVSGAASGEAALKKANAERFDLIVLDLMLPGIDGLEVARRLRLIDWDSGAALRRRYWCMTSKPGNQKTSC